MSALVLLVLVARGQASDPTTIGAVNAAHELLHDLDVKVREIDRMPTDEQALEIGRSTDAFAIVELAWDSPEHRQARVHFHIEPRLGWNDRVIGFNPGDDLVERGRTIGFAVASMLPIQSTNPEPARATESPSQATSERSTEPRDALAPVLRGGAGHPRQRIGEVDALGATSLGIQGEAPGWGGRVGARWYFLPRVGFSLGASARAGQIVPAQATSLHLHVSAGVAWLAIAATAARPFALGVRLAILAVHERLTHFDSDDPVPADASRWIPGMDSAIEGSWMFNDMGGVVGALAMETVFGRTDVTLHEERVATIPMLRMVLEAGIRARF